MTLNDEVIESYDRNWRQWMTLHPPARPEMQKRYPRVNRWLRAAVAGLPVTARILEIGSNLGGSAFYLRQLGYQVECSDAAPAAVTWLREQGAPVRELNVMTGDLGGPWDVITAEAVLEHVPDLPAVLRRIRGALAIDGKLAFSLPEGPDDWYMDERLASARYWHTWSEEAARLAVAGAGFASFAMQRYISRDGTTWMLIQAGIAPPRS